MKNILLDLAIGLPYVKGQNLPVRNCWHFSTDGTARDVLFRDRDDFVAGMNRIYTLARKYGIIMALGITGVAAAHVLTLVISVFFMGLAGLILIVVGTLAMAVFA